MEQKCREFCEGIVSGKEDRDVGRELGCNSTCRRDECANAQITDAWGNVQDSPVDEAQPGNMHLFDICLQRLSFE